MSENSRWDLQAIVTDPKGAEKLVEAAKTLGRDLEQMGLTTSQIRLLFGEVRQIQGQWSIDATSRQKAARRLILLKPKMAYRSRSERGKGVQELVSVLEPALDLVIQEKDPIKQDGNFQRFVEFFEAILAYHKSFGGR